MHCALQSSVRTPKCSMLPGARVQTSYFFQGQPDQGRTLSTDASGPQDKAFSVMDTREDVSAEIFYLEPVARQQPPDATAAGANSTNSGGSAPKAPARV